MGSLPSERVGAATDVGLVREANEDALLVLREAGCVAVADGLGGHAAGEVASALAVEALTAALPAVADAGEDEVAGMLVGAVQSAHRAVVADADRDPGRHGMGTTVVVAHVRPARAWVAHVGDSRAYLVGGSSLVPVTLDHGAGGMLTQALGLGDVEPDVTALDVEAGQRLLLCTDGLTGTTAEPEIAELARAGSPQEACERLVEAARRGGGFDNTTVVLVDLE